MANHSAHQLTGGEYGNRYPNLDNVSEEVEIQMQSPAKIERHGQMNPDAQAAFLDCSENIDFGKEIFDEQVPGVWEYERDQSANAAVKKPMNRLRTELEPEDVRLVNELGQLSADNLMEYMRKIKDLACDLGQKQETQCQRGKSLRIFK